MPQAAIAAITVIGAEAVGAAAAGVAFKLSSAVIAKAVFTAAVAQISSMAMKPDSAPNNAPLSRQTQDRKFTIRSPTSAGRLIYGRTRLAGVMPFAESTGEKNRYLHMVLALSHRPITDIRTAFFNSEHAEDDRFENVVRMARYLGTQTEADPDLVEEVEDWTEDHVGRGCPYLYARLQYVQSVWLSGIPNISMVLEGHEIYDPRDAGVTITTSEVGEPGVVKTATAHGFKAGTCVWVAGHAGAETDDGETLRKAYRIGTVPTTTSLTLLDADLQPVALEAGGTGGTITAMKWSENAALCILDYMLSDDGADCDPDWEIDWPSWIAAANRCDEWKDVPGDWKACRLERETASPDPIRDWVNIEVEQYNSRENKYVTVVKPSYQIVDYENFVRTGSAVVIETGDPVRLVDGSIPEPIVEGQTYYAIRKGATKIMLAETREDAMNGAAIDLTTHGACHIEALDRFRTTKALGGAHGTFVEIGSDDEEPTVGASGYLIPSDFQDGFRLAESYEAAQAGESLSFAGLGHGDLNARLKRMRRYTCNGVVELGPKRKNNLERLLSCCNGQISWSQSGFRLIIGGPDLSVLTIDEDMLAAGAIEINTAPSVDDLFNEAQGIYSGPETRYEGTDYSKVTDETWVEEDGEPLEAQMDMPFTNTDFGCQRIVRVAMANSHQGLVCRMPFDQSVMGVEAGDVVALSMPRFGFDGKLFRLERAADGAEGKAAFHLTLREEASEAWEVGPEQMITHDFAPNTRLAPPGAAVVPPTLGEPESGDAYLLRLQDGTLLTRIRLPILDNEDGFVGAGGRILIRYRKVTAATEGPWKTAVAEGDAEAVFLTDVEDLSSYEIQARSENAFGVQSAWSDHVYHTALGKSERPPDVPGLYREGNRIVWSYPAPPRDFRGFHVRTLAGRTRNWQQGRAFPSDGAILNQREIALAAVGQGVQTVMVKAVDTSGNESESAAILTVGLGQYGPANVLFTQDEAATGFPGDRTNAELDDGVLAAEDTGDLYLPNETALYLPNETALYLPLTYRAAEYAFDFVPAREDVPCEVFLTSDISGEGWRTDYRRAGTDAVYLGNDDEPYLVDGAAAYLGGPDDWRPVVGQIAAGRERLTFRVTLEAGARQGRIAGLAANVDVPDVVESFEDLVIADGGTRVPITKSYRAIKAIGEITLQDDGFDATNVVVVDMDAIQGPLLRAVGAAQATIDIHQMKGY